MGEISDLVMCSAYRYDETTYHYSKVHIVRLTTKERVKPLADVQVLVIDLSLFRDNVVLNIPSYQGVWALTQFTVRKKRDPAILDRDELFLQL